ncbi:unnamed protein product [Arabis nemorensis]|uniref:CCHC-type domain-containing protein n=1 Tax=Arabis nemorensis TaxID=586526 RepID=A0A565C5H8_9BRAS|nr:unnamed protein product [Arabis nemorensis]
MAPRGKQTSEDQQEDFKQILENFTNSLQNGGGEQAVENALMTVLQTQQRRAHNDVNSEDGGEDNVFAFPQPVQEERQRAARDLRQQWGNTSSRSRYPSQQGGDPNSPSPRASSVTKTEQPTDSIACSRQPHTGASRCFTCGETGHRQTACPT